MIASSTIRQVSGGATDWLVYGMTWEHVSGARPERRSLQRAKARKASHYIAAHENSAAVGLARLGATAGKGKTKSQRRYTSAGILFASQRLKGVFVGQSDLQEDGIWLIASHDGVVIPGFDLVLDHSDQVEDAVARLREHHNDVQVVDVNVPTLEEVKNQPNARLIVVKTSAQQIPTWMKLCAVVLVAYGLYSEGQVWLDEYLAERDQAQNPTQKFDFNVERAKQLDDWQSSIRLDSQESLVEILQQVGGLPMGFGGWTLAVGMSMAGGVSAPAIQCLPIASGWSCAVLYSRTAAGTNESFKRLAPRHCTVGWVDLEKAQLKCEFKATRLALDRKNIDLPETINLVYIPQVQRVLLAFREVTLHPSAPVPFTNPVVVNQRGEHISVPQSGPVSPQARVPAKQRFTFSGPLRSLTVLPLNASSVITSLKVRRLDVADPTLNSSALSAVLEGEMYVQ